jgi:transposase
MTLDQNFLGIDVSKAYVDVFYEQDARLARVPNRAPDLAVFASALDPASLVVLEATGRYDRALCAALERAGVRYARVNPLRARDFARAVGQLAKTDQLDARMLAQMGRALALTPQPQSQAGRDRLTSLSRRRDQLVNLRAREANHAESADPQSLDGIERHIAWLNQEIEALDQAIAALIQADPELAHVNGLLRSTPGVGPVAATTLLALLPELGTRSDKAIAALAGLAPLNRDSGTLRGSRHIGPGRSRVRKALYMAALNAIRCSQRLKASYLGLRNRGKPAKLALIAVARKLVVILNAMIRNHTPFKA